MPASVRDAQYGWELFKQSGYSLSLAEINRDLRRAGFRQISQRMFQHYHKLFRYGYEEYLPINQLDVRTLANPVWDAATRNRYAFREVSIEVDLRLIHRKRFVTFRGLATRISDAVVVVRLTGEEAEEVAAAKIKASDQRAEVVFRQTGEILLGVIESVYAEARNKVVMFRIGFSDVGSVETLALRKPLGVRTLRIEIQPRREKVYLADVVQSLYWVFQSIEAARAAGDEILLDIEKGNDFALPATRVTRLSLQSPFQLELLASAPAILLVLMYVRRLIRLRKEFFEGSVAKQQAEVNRAIATKTRVEARVQEATATRLEWENAQRQSTSSVTPDPIVVQTEQLIRRLLVEEGATTRKRSRVSDKALNIIESQVRPALVSLVEAVGDAEITLETDQEIEEQNGLP